MSLQVWLPMTKDLRNQGLADVTVTNNGATFNSSGKLGGCYSFDGNDDFVSLDGSILYDVIKGGESPFSITMWIYRADSTRAILFGDYSLSGSIGFNIELNTSHSVRFYWNGSPDTSGGHTLATLNNWTHLAITYDGTKICFYMNGTLTDTYAVTLTTKTKTSGMYYLGRDSRTGSTAFNGKMNDVRIYDHCLSPMEIKQISQGLVLHYPLDNNGVDGENILVNTSFQSQYVQSTGWDTTKNGTQLANSWGGYNAGVTNASTVYHAHLKELNGEWVYEYIRTANESWLGISQSGLNSKLTAGKTYTFSWEEYRVEGNNYSTGGLYYYKTGASSASFHLGQFRGSSGNILGKWRKFSYTFIAPTDGDYSKNMSWYIYGMSGGIGKMYIRHPKLEEGAKPTPWCPNENDELATAMGLNSTTEYDCSGFCNNGTRTGTFNWTSNTPKYAVSQIFNGTDNAIQTPSLPTMITDKNYTIAVWIYKTAIGSKTYQTIYGGPSGFELEARNGTTTEAKFVGWNWGKPAAAYEFNEWNHCVFVHSDDDCRVYLNGEYVATGTAKASNPSGNYFVGAWNTATQQNFEGLMSDFRIYATALSASDVLSLYQNSAYIDSSGNVYGAIHTEA